MIHLTRINRSPLVLNSDLIEFIEKTPDTVISLTNGLKLLVRESPDDIINKVIAFRQGVLRGLSGGAGSAATTIFAFPGSRPERRNEDEE